VIDERFENVQLQHPEVARGRQIDEPSAVPDPAVVDAGVRDWIEPSNQIIEETPSNSEESNSHNPIITKNALRLDPALIEDYVLKTVLPQEMQRVGYGVTPKIVYAVRQRFGDAAVPLVPGLLTDFVKSRKLEEKPREGCWRLV